MRDLFARLAAVTMLAGAAIAFVPPAATAHEGCETPQDVPIVLEFGSLDGEDRVVCAQHSAGSNALEALHEAGIETQLSTGSMPMVCRIDALPTPDEESCGNALSGAGYWAFLVAKEGQDWGYASVGLQDYELAEGDFVALRYHLMADGENVPVEAAADADTRSAAIVAGHETGDEAEELDDQSPAFAEIALPVAIVAAVLVAVAAFAVARRRRA